MALDVELTRHRFTLDEYHRMAEAGILKAALYAEAGVQEYWLVDLEGNAVEVYRGPSADGFQSVQRVGVAETLSPLAFPDVRIEAGVILS